MQSGCRSHQARLALLAVGPSLSLDAIAAMMRR
jgi:hypothetical protein